MGKYDAYNNELTEFLSMYENDNSLKDIIGDIVGDIYYANIPSNMPDEDIEIEVETVLGPMTIEILSGEDKRTIKFTRKIGGSIMESKELDILREYGDKNNYLVQGTTLEERDKGVIVTSNRRYYASNNSEYSSWDLREYSEERKALTYGNIKFYNHLNFKELALEEKNRYILELIDNKRSTSSTFLGEGIFGSSTNTSLKIVIPTYTIDGTHSLMNKYPIKPTVIINGIPMHHHYGFIEGPKKLERINDLIHGIISSKNIGDIKYISNHNNEDDVLMHSFNLLSIIQSRIAYKSETKGKTFLPFTETELIGPTKVKMPISYYEYLKDLIMENFSIFLDTPKNQEEVVELLKKVGTPHEQV